MRRITTLKAPVTGKLPAMARPRSYRVSGWSAATTRYWSATRLQQRGASGKSGHTADLRPSNGLSPTSALNTSPGNASAI